MKMGGLKEVERVEMFGRGWGERSEGGVRVEKVTSME